MTSGGNKPPKLPEGQRRLCDECQGEGFVEIPNGTRNCPGCLGAGYVIIGNV